MEINLEIITNILKSKGENNFEIIEISLTGSKLFVENSKKDIDVSVIASGISKEYLRFKVDELDIFVYSPEFRKRQVNLEESDFWTFWAGYQLVNKKIYGGFDFENNLFINQEKYKEIMKRVLYNSAINNELKFKKFPYKIFSLPYLILKFYDNSNLKISEEIKNTYIELHTTGNKEAVLYVCKKSRLNSERVKEYE